MNKKWTRRDIARWGFAIPALLLPDGVKGQTAPPDPTADLFAKAREGNKSHSEALAKVDLPMSTEPAFVFRA